MSNSGSKTLAAFLWTATAAIAGCWVHAQASPTFEVASVKPAPRELLLQRGLMCGFLGERFMAIGDGRWIISCAYSITPARASQEIQEARRG